MIVLSNAFIYRSVYNGIFFVKLKKLKVGDLKYIVIDPVRGSVIIEMYQKAGYDDWSGQRLKAWLEEEKGFTNRQGKPIALSQVFLIFTNPFYHGSFEYPVGSGKWFTSGHEPLVSKELFDLVQEVRGIQRGVWGSKQFA